MAHETQAAADIATDAPRPEPSGGEIFSAWQVLIAGLVLGPLTGLSLSAWSLWNVGRRRSAIAILLAAVALTIFAVFVALPFWPATWPIRYLPLASATLCRAVHGLLFPAEALATARKPALSKLLGIAGASIAGTALVLLAWFVLILMPDLPFAKRVWTMSGKLGDQQGRLQIAEGSDPAVTNPAWRRVEELAWRGILSPEQVDDLGAQVDHALADDRLEGSEIDHLVEYAGNIADEWSRDDVLLRWKQGGAYESTTRITRAQVLTSDIEQALSASATTALTTIPTGNPVTLDIRRLDGGDFEVVDGGIPLRFDETGAVQGSGGGSLLGTTVALPPDPFPPGAVWEVADGNVLRRIVLIKEAVEGPSYVIESRSSGRLTLAEIEPAEAVMICRSVFLQGAGRIDSQVCITRLERPSGPLEIVEGLRWMQPSDAPR